MRGANTFLKVGLPMVLLMAGGAYGLSTFTATQFEEKDKRVIKKSKHTLDIEEEHRRMMLRLNDKDYSLSRVPRASEPDTVERVKRELRTKSNSRRAAAARKADTQD